VLLFNMDLGAPGSGGPGPRGGVGLGERARALQGELLDRLRRFPGVQAAGTSLFALMGGASTPIISPPVRFPGRAPEPIRPRFLAVSPGFFATMQIPLLSGREFAAGDIVAGAPTAVIVNQTFARQFFPGEDALGKRFERMVDDNGNYGAQEIVGVVRDTKYNNLREAAAPTIYQPAGGVGSTVEVRTAGSPLAMAAALRQEIERVDASLRVTGMTLQSTRIDQTILQERMLALLGGFFALVAVVLAAVGLHGVLSYAVGRRTKEIGIRVALGAPVASVIRVVAGDVAVAVAIGVAGGLAGGLALARLLASLLFEVKPSDFGSIALPLASLLLASAVAAIPPAMRAARVDPMEALRYE
jgi:predicted permease